MTIQVKRRRRIAFLNGIGSDGTLEKSKNGAEVGSEAFRAYGQKLSIEPGDRQLEVVLFNAGGEASFHFNAAFAAGHQYKLTPERRKVSYFRPIKGSFVLTDETTGAVENYPKPAPTP